MTDHHVGALRLHVRSHGDPQSDLQAHARAFAESLLEAITRRLEDRTGGRLVLIRRLPVRLRASQALLADRDEIERLAEGIAASIMIDEETEPSHDVDVVVFANEVEWRAAYLIHLARGDAPRWYFDRLSRADDACGGITSLTPSLAATALERVDDANALPQLLGRLPVEAIEKLAELLSVPHPPASLPAKVTAMPEVQAQLRLAIIDGVHRSSRSLDAVPVVPAPASIERERPVDANDAVVVTDHTRHAGLVYLVSALIELEAGETLWRACVPEQNVIADAFDLVIGGADDPAPRLLGGAQPGSGFEASSEQRAEIVSSLCAALYHALPRRSLATIPAVDLVFVDDDRGRVLYALADSLPIFAAPAPTIPAAREAVQAFFRIWPTGPILASPAICEIAAASRASVASHAGVPVYRRQNLPLHAALISSVVAGTAACLFQARVGDRDLAVAGRIHDEEGARIVTMPMESIRIPVRRARLDIDPGWVGWLSRDLRIVFGDAPPR